MAEVKKNQYIYKMKEKRGVEIVFNYRKNAAFKRSIKKFNSK